MSTEKEMPKKTLSLKVGQNVYDIKFPNNRQLIEIERMKIDLAGGHGNRMLTGDTSSQLAYVTSQMIASFTVLIPELRKDLTIDSLLDLDPIQTKDLMKEYEKYYNWIQDWMEIINKGFDKEEKEEVEK